MITIVWRVESERSFLWFAEFHRLANEPASLILSAASNTR